MQAKEIIAIGQFTLWSFLLLLVSISIIRIESKSRFIIQIILLNYFQCLFKIEKFERNSKSFRVAKVIFQLMTIKNNKMQNFVSHFKQKSFNHREEERKKRDKPIERT